MEKNQDFNIDSTKKIIFYHTKNLCHRIKHTLFYVWLKYGAI
jgi:hypothetical protein